jgi:transcriptional regulator with XRE-family HTH domain
MHRVRDPLVDEHVVGAEVRRLRIARNITQKGLAQRANMSDAWLRRIENGYDQPSRGTAVDIAAALGVALPQILAAGAWVAPSKPPSGTPQADSGTPQAAA